MVDYISTTNNATTAPILAQATSSYTLRTFTPYTETASIYEPYEEVLMVLKQICDLLADLCGKKKIDMADFDLDGIRDFLDSVKTNGQDADDPMPTITF